MTDKHKVTRSRANRLKVVLIKPSKYKVDGFVERYESGSLPNTVLPYMRSLTPASLHGCPIEVHAADEYVQPELGYLGLLKEDPECRTLLALVGVQSHQFHRTLDLAAYARRHGVKLAIAGGPHPMTCETRDLQGRGLSFALSEAELIWDQILGDAIETGELRPMYGGEARWAQRLDPPVLVPPFGQVLGIYPSRGCPYRCNFCSVIKIAGRKIRSQPVETTMKSLRAAKKEGVQAIIFTSDNFNKYEDAWELLEAMIEEKIHLPFTVQCDTQIAKREDFVALLGRAGCSEIFLGIESIDRKILKAANKFHNQPALYRKIVEMCREHGISTMFSNVLGFPNQKEADIREQMEVMLELSPDLAAFYVLTPIPGTEQYDDFMRDGRIWERNLDRYDASMPTWHHSELSPQQLTDLLYECFLTFYAPRAVKERSHHWRGRQKVNNWFKSHYMLRTAEQRMHPMTGGVNPQDVDHVSSYIDLRRNMFGVDLADLPKSLTLSSHDDEINRQAKINLPKPARA